MSNSDITFHRVEEYRFHGLNEPFVVLSVETERFGYVQIKYTRSGLKEFASEPNINMFTKEDQQKIEKIAAIVYRIVLDAPAAKERFEKGETFKY